MEIHVDLSIREEIESGPEAVEEGRRWIKPKTTNSVQRESGGQGGRQDGKVKRQDTIGGEQELKN